jgi:hypothetical protein
MLLAPEEGHPPLSNSERARGLGRGDQDDPLRSLPGWGDEGPASRMRPYHMKALARAQMCDEAERARWEARGRPVAFTTADGVAVEEVDGLSDEGAGPQPEARDSDAEARGPAAAGSESNPPTPSGPPVSETDPMTTGDWDGCTTSEDVAAGNITTADGERIVSRVRVEHDSESNTEQKLGPF